MSNIDNSIMSLMEEIKLNSGVYELNEGLRSSESQLKAMRKMIRKLETRKDKLESKGKKGDAKLTEGAIKNCKVLLRNFEGLQKDLITAKQKKDKASVSRLKKEYKVLEKQYYEFLKLIKKDDTLNHLIITGGIFAVIGFIAFAVFSSMEIEGFIHDIGPNPIDGEAKVLIGAAEKVTGVEMLFDKSRKALVLDAQKVANQGALWQLETEHNKSLGPIVQVKNIGTIAGKVVAAIGTIIVGLSGLAKNSVVAKNTVRFLKDLQVKARKSTK